MGIQRVPQAPFAQIANAALRDKRLSFKARGLLAMVLSHAGEWEASLDWLIGQSDGDGKTAVQSALNELTKFGYREVSHERLANGQVRTVTQWFHQPVSRPPGNPAPGSPDRRLSGASIEHHLSEHYEEQEHNEVMPDPADQAETVNQRSNRIAKCYTDAVPLSRFPAVAGIVKKAVNAGYGDQEIVDAVLRIAGEGRSLTVETLRIEIEGLTPRGRMSGTEMYARVAESMASGDAMTALEAAEGLR